MVMHITSSSVNEQGTQEMIRGHKGSLTMAGNRVELRPERPYTDEIDPETSEAFSGENVEAHEKNWFDCIRSNKAPNCGIELATRVQTIVSLAEISERLNVMCVFDAKTRKVTTGDAAKSSCPPTAGRNCPGVFSIITPGFTGQGPVKPGFVFSHANRCRRRARHGHPI